MWPLIWLVTLSSFTHLIHAAPHIVSLPHRKYAGVALSNGVSQWLGIPFAAPPIGDLRFAPPIDPSEGVGTHIADTHGPLCIATGAEHIPEGQSEDCLYLAVYAPSTATPTSKLPVFVFIQGGGFNANANPNLNGTGLVQASENNIIVVTFNYRVGPWGFLASAEASLSNNGLRDQRKALQWVQKYIAAFGGDPGHVVLGGDSAGAASIALHLTAYGGRNDNLFHAAAAESVSFATILTPAESQYQYDAFAKSVGCYNYDSLACLRAKSAQELQAQNNNIPYPGQRRAPIFMFNPTLDGDFVTDLTYNAFSQGKFVNVPVIVGDDTNGGTIFAPRGATCMADTDEFLVAHFPYLTPSQIDKINDMYPAPEHDCPAGKCWWRQAANVYGEMRYMCPSLYVSSAFANVTSLDLAAKIRPLAIKGKPISSVGGGSTIRPPIPNALTPRTTYATKSSTIGKSWSYRYNVEDPTQISLGLGVPHTVEVNAIFGPENVPAGTAPASYFKYKSNENVVPVIQAYWTSFIRTFDPNTHKLEWAARWEEYYAGDGQPQRLVFQSAGGTAMERVDGGLRGRCAYLQGIGPMVKQRV